MSKIDLSKAKIGDKFRTRDGRILEYVGENSDYDEDKYKLKDKYDFINHFFQYGGYLKDEEYHLDLVEQVFDKGDLLDNNISVEERMQAIVEMAKIEYEKAKELGVAIQNLPYIVEQLKEDNPELQRRQEVLKFADMLFFNQKDTRVALFRYDEAIKVAENIVNIRDEYLKEGKL